MLARVRDVKVIQGKGKKKIENKNQDLLVWGQDFYGSKILRTVWRYSKHRWSRVFLGPTEDKVVVQWSLPKCLVYLHTRCLFKACDVLDAEQSNGCRSHLTHNPVHSYYDKALSGQGDQPRITDMKWVWHGHTAINWDVVSASKSPMLKPTEAWGMIMATL